MGEGMGVGVGVGLGMGVGGWLERHWVGHGRGGGGVGFFVVTLVFGFQLGGFFWEGWGLGV